MAWLEGVLRAVQTASVDWNLVLRFLEVLIWPFVVLAGLAIIRPGRLIDHLIENGGEISGAGATIKLAKRIDEVSESVRTDEETSAPSEIVPSNPLEESGDPYTTIMNGWGLIAQGIEEALERTGLGDLDRRNPMEAVKRLRRGDWIGNRLQDNTQRLWDVRNQVKVAGSTRLKKLGIDRAAADDFYESAGRVKRGFQNAISYRERRAASSAASMTPTLPGLEPGAGASGTIN